MAGLDPAIHVNTRQVCGSWMAASSAAMTLERRMTSSISYAVDGDGIATLTIDQPGKSMNLIGQDFVGEFAAAIERAVGDAAVKGIIVTSGKSSFIAGADLIGMEGLIAHARTAPAAELSEGHIEPDASAAAA